MRAQAGLLILILLCLVTRTQASGNFCPRLEGVNLQCQPEPPPGEPPPPGRVVCPPSTENITCYTCTSEGSQVSASFSSECTSWTCKVELSPEGLPRKTAECGSRSSCCSESISGCCQNIETSSGTRTIMPDCSQSVSCPGGGAPYAPRACGNGGGGSCQGATSCSGDASPPGDCQ
ncbi:MAG: hypothetical protein K2X47_09605 [Bdellovibrionales bacterium]|nr:hypothetical protein [Bdellovibrionales bacterium]